MIQPKHQIAIGQLANLFYDFLPATGAHHWKGHITFLTVAKEVGLGICWNGGNKKSLIIKLLETAYGKTNGNFEKLIISIVNHGLIYRDNKKKPITREEIIHINEVLLSLERKYKYLWDEKFLNSLPHADCSTFNGDSNNIRKNKINYLNFKTIFENLIREENKQKAGFDFESFVIDVFNAFELDAKRSLICTGEQIDGSFVLDNETYLLEVKYTSDKIQEKDLLIFRGKIEGKSSITRGVFISYAGYTDNAINAITQGKQPNFFLVDGEEIYNLLNMERDLNAFLRSKRRAMAEGNIFYKNIKW